MYYVSACTQNLWRDHPWLGRTTCGAVDDPGGSSMAAKSAVDGPRGPIWWDHRWCDS